MSVYFILQSLKVFQQKKSVYINSFVIQIIIFIYINKHVILH